MSINEKDDDFFDFSEQILGEPTEDQKKQKSLSTKNTTNLQTEIQTSYLLVNALLNLLIRKGIIYPHEVQVLISELHQDYTKKRGSSQ